MRVKVQDCRKAVAVYYGLNRAQLIAKNQEFKVSHPRQLAMTVARELTGASLPDIGYHLGGFHHASVLHALEATDERMRQDEGLALDYLMIQQLAGRIAVDRHERDVALVARAIETGEIISAEAPLIEQQPMLEAAE